MPLLWAYGADKDSLEGTLADDPSIDTASLVTAFDDKLLYQIEWDDSLCLLFDMITNSHAVILDIHGEVGTWTLRLLYPDRDSLSNTHRFCDDHRMRLNIRSVREMDDEHVGQFGLTSKQYEALTTAYERGYYQAPRGTALQELADELDIPHQALSERLRRATMIFIREGLLADPPSSDTRT